MTNGSRYDPTTRDLVERVFAIVTKIHADQRAVMIDMYGEGTTPGLKKRVVDLEISQSVGKRWVAAVTTLISVIMVTAVTAVKAIWFNN